ncbi:MAG: DUF2975 domain-containing protein [Ruminococcus sp.]|nr:DUF2975 domain-containing protein [Ruminococcus sp.]
MNWKSVTALKAAVAVCMVLVVAVAAGAPWIIGWYAEIRDILPNAQTAILICYYLCAIPALIALFYMLKLLRQIKLKRPFDKASPNYLSMISWCCLAVAGICAVGGIWYPPLFFVCASMLFLFLAVRVVCSCFVAAAKLQEENDLTV